ncbi:hypothetical protein [Flavobacterium sp.]|uniref:hypothetical protein n=1 Tax=Flavobacterium sp. TaxID=239 RepID=UPI0026056A73|nr:hypothetical protein [Flavobacterium sp.]
MDVKNGMAYLEPADHDLWKKLLGRDIPVKIPVLLLRELGEHRIREFQEDGCKEKAMLCTEHVSKLPERLLH